MKHYLNLLEDLKIDLDFINSQCENLYPFLKANNEKKNLTRIINKEDFWIKHVLDSLLLLRFKPTLIEGEYEIADLGCGAGFPALVLALALPKSRLTAIDSIGKKTEFVSQAGKFLKLNNLKVVKGRGRELSAQADWEGKFDIVTARAVGETKKLFRESRRMLKPDGLFIFYKTPESAENEIGEIRKISELDWDLSPVYDFLKIMENAALLLVVNKNSRGLTFQALPGTKK